MAELRPEPPSGAGVAEESPDYMQEEPARLLANAVRERLQADGFTDRQIDLWAETYIAEKGSGDEEGLLDWIATRERDPA